MMRLREMLFRECKITRLDSEYSVNKTGIRCSWAGTRAHCHYNELLHTFKLKVRKRVKAYLALSGIYQFVTA